MAKVSRLFIYPVKSLAGVEIDSIQLTERGLANDRRWLLIDEKGVHVTQRTHPQLVLFKVTILSNGLKVSYDEESISIPSEPKTENEFSADVWGDVFLVQEVSEEISNWFTAKLKQSVKLVYQTDKSIRKVDPSYATDKNQIVSAADGYPVLVISEESLKFLNEKLEKPITMERFRPNIVVKDVEKEHQEDEWKNVTIGKTSLVGVKKCSRCSVIMIDPTTAQSGKEPLQALSRYRKEGSKVLFGNNFIPIRLGTINVNDTIQS